MEEVRLSNDTIKELSENIANVIKGTRTPSTNYWGDTDSEKSSKEKREEYDKQKGFLKTRNEIIKKEKEVLEEKLKIIKEENNKIEKEKENLNKEKEALKDEKEKENIDRKIKELEDKEIENKEKINSLNREGLELAKEEYTTNTQLNKNLKEREKVSGWKGTLKDGEKVIQHLKAAYDNIKTLNEPWARADHAASKFTKTIGMAKAGMEALRKQSLENVGWNGFGRKYNISSEELIQAQTNYIKGIGRNISMSNDAQENMAAIRAVAGDRGLEIASQFENFGISMEGTGQHIHKMFTEASKQGLSFEKYSENVTKNIRIAQNYTFKDGLKGLENMAKKATAIKLDMQQVANFADKVSTVEGSIETAAKLQVLGGPFASMADPMGMLNESLNDMEGFQDRISKIYGQLGHFDKTTGQVVVSSFNKKRLRAYAEATGQDYNSVMETVHTTAKRDEILKQINASKAAGLDNDMKELIANTATFRDGKAGVSINGDFKTLDQITDDDRKILEQQSQDQGKDIKQIAMDLRSLVDMREGVAKQRDGLIGSIMSFLGHLEKIIIGFAGGAIAGGLAGGTILKHGGGLIGSISNARKGIGNMIKGVSLGNIGKGLGNSAKTVGRGVANIAKISGRGISSIGKYALSGGKWLLGKGAALLGGMGPLGWGALAGGALLAGGLALRSHIKNKRKKALDANLKSLGIERVGDYGPSKLKKINQALATGVISDSLRQKLINNGDIDIVNEIDRVNNSKNATSVSRAKNDKLTIENAFIDIKNGNLKDFSGIKNTTTVSAIPTISNGNGFVKETIKNTNNINSQINPTNITLDLNINGNLKLVGEKGQSIDMVDYYRKHPEQLREVADLMKNAIMEKIKGTHIANNNNTSRLI